MRAPGAAAPIRPARPHGCLRASQRSEERAEEGRRPTGVGLGLGGQGEASGLSHSCPAAAPLGFPAWLPPHHPGLAPEPLTSAHGPEVQLNLGRVLGLAWSSWSRASRSGVFQTGRQHPGREAAAPASLLFTSPSGNTLALGVTPRNPGQLLTVPSRVHFWGSPTCAAHLGCRPQGPGSPSPPCPEQAPGVKAALQWPNRHRRDDRSRAGCQARASGTQGSEHHA